MKKYLRIQKFLFLLVRELTPKEDISYTGLITNFPTDRYIGFYAAWATRKGDWWTSSDNLTKHKFTWGGKRDYGYGLFIGRLALAILNNSGTKEFAKKFSCVFGQ